MKRDLVRRVKAVPDYPKQSRSLVSQEELRLAEVVYKEKRKDHATKQKALIKELIGTGQFYDLNRARALRRLRVENMRSYLI